jgi:hypothetical protein
MPSAASALQIRDNMASCKHQSRQNKDVPSDWMKVTAFLVMVDITTYPWTKCAFRTSRPGIHHTLTNELRYVHFEGSALLQYNIASMHNQFQTFQWYTVPSHSRVQIPEKSCKISRPSTMKALITQ